jgi:hypothetical protein
MQLARAHVRVHTFFLDRRHFLFFFFEPLLRTQCAREKKKTPQNSKQKKKKNNESEAETFFARPQTRARLCLGAEKVCSRKGKKKKGLCRSSEKARQVGRQRRRRRRGLQMYSVMTMRQPISGHVSDENGGGGNGCDVQHWRVVLECFGGDRRGGSRRCCGGRGWSGTVSPPLGERRDEAWRAEIRHKSPEAGQRHVLCCCRRRL